MKVADGIKVANQLEPCTEEIILDYLGEPGVITSVPIRERGRQEDYSQSDALWERLN